MAQPKRFVAKSMQEAVELVKAELGPTAVIYQTRSFFEDGQGGSSKDKKVEVLAGLVQEDELKMEEVLGTKAELPEKMTGLLANKEGLENPGHLKQISRKLMDCGLEKELARKIENIVSLHTNMDFNNEEDLLAFIKKTIIERLPAIKPIRPGGEDGPQTIAFVGPTGVGKTTAIAKLAANFSEVEKANVGIISIDFKRVGGLDQLKAYSRIFNLDLEVAINEEQLKAAIRKFGGKSLLFVDTPGLNPFNGREMKKLKELVCLEEIDEILLVLGLNVKDADLFQIIESFKSFAISGFLFTKLDETRSWGSLLNITWNRQEYISYISLGQDVPSDIELLHPQRFLDALFAFSLNEGGGLK